MDSDRVKVMVWVRVRDKDRDRDRANLAGACLGVIYGLDAG
jgi:hypothetical protein